jgi:hypothetical protein
MSLSDEMRAMFQIAPRHWACEVMWRAGTLMLSPWKFERFLRTADGESIEDCVRRKYGEAAVKLCYRALQGESL